MLQVQMKLGSIYFHFIHVSIVPTYVYVHHFHACWILWTWELQMIGYEPPYGSWESNLGPLEEQPVLQTTELFLQPWKL